MRCKFSKKQCEEADKLAMKWLRDYKEAKKNPEKLREKYYTVDYQGETYKAHSISYGTGSFLFHDTPILNHVYRMLSDDLSKHYDIKISHAIL